VISSRRRATVTVLGAEELERRGVQSIRDVTRYEPGVTVGNQPARTGRSSYVIRGIGKNRVLVTVDGVRVPDFPSNAQPGTFTRDYLDLESIKAPRDHPRTRLLGRARALADAGMAVVIILHDLNEALAVADRGVLLDGGAVAASGPIEDVLRPDLLSRIYGTTFARIGNLIVPDYAAARRGDALTCPRSP
jgi:hypothetical protein